MDEKTQHLYAFGPFRLDAGEYLLLLDGRPVPLPPKAFEALLMLGENAGHLVDKNELMKRLWPDTFVEDGNLAKHVSLLRKTLSEASNGQEYIETIPKRGYRFIAEVSIPTGSIANLPPSAPSGTTLPQVITAVAPGPEPTEKASERTGGSEYQRGGEILELRSQEQNRPKRRGSRLILVVVTFSVLAVAAAAVWVRTHQ